LLLDFFIVSCIYTILFIKTIIMRILIALLWLIFGSLGSVILTRFSDGVTQKKLHGFFFWFSECPECKHRLTAKNLLPLISYLIQGGKCWYCSKNIPWIYPVLEILSAWIFLLTYFFLKDFWTWILVFWLLTNRLLILLLVYDLRTYELHMIVRILLVITWILANIIAPGWNLRYAMLSVLVFAWVFMWIYFFARRYAKMRFDQAEWFGQGDIYLASVIWLFLPLVLSLQWMIFSWWTIINVLILFTLLSSILGLIRSVFQFFIKKIFNNSPSVLHNLSLAIIPFFPAMILAFWIITWKGSYFISLIFG